MTKAKDDLEELRKRYYAAEEALFEAERLEERAKTDLDNAVKNRDDAASRVQALRRALKKALDEEAFDRAFAVELRRV